MTDAIQKAREALLLTAGALQAGRTSMAPQVAFNGKWAYLGVRRVSEILDIADIALAAIDAALEGWAVPKVQALEWVKPLDESSTLLRAETDFGIYSIWTHHEANGEWFWNLVGSWTISDERSGVAASSEAAQAAAQADYERRILSALDLPSPTTGA